MKLITELGQGQGYLKGGFLGFAKSGKTYTAALLAIAVRKLLGDKRPLVCYDTEGGSEYIAPMVKALTGVPLLGIKSRDFSELLQVADEACECGSGLLVDSVTHIWRSLCESYLAGKNESQKQYYESKGWKNFRPQKDLDLKDWGPLKAEWAKWSDFYINAPINILVCGRAGDVWSMEENKQTHKKELVKTGVRMKTESEFGFEPSLLVEMQADQVQDKDGNWQLLRTAYVLGDRWGDLDGLQQQFPSIKSENGQPDYAAELAIVEAFFAPHLARLKPKSHSPIRTASTPMDVDTEGNPEWHREQKTREILCEEIKGSLQRGEMDGQSTEAKKARAELLAGIFGTTSWTAIEGLSSSALRPGLAQLKERLGLDQAPSTKAPADDDVPMFETLAPTTKNEPPAAKVEPAAGAPKPAPAAPVTDPGEVSRLRGELMDAIFGSEEKVLAWMRSVAWLTAGQDFLALPVERLRQAVKQKGLLLQKAEKVVAKS